MASTSWGLAAAGFGGGGGLAGFGAPAGGQQGGEPVETLLVGQTRCVFLLGFGGEIRCAWGRSGGLYRSMTACLRTR